MEDYAVAAVRGCTASALCVLNFSQPCMYDCCESTGILTLLFSSTNKGNRNCPLELLYSAFLHQQIACKKCSCPPLKCRGRFLARYKAHV